MKRLLFIVLLILALNVNSWATLLAGNAILLDGVDDFACIPDASHLGGMSSLTVELWFMPYDTSQVNPLVTKSDGIAISTDRSFELTLHPHTPSWSVFTGSTGWTWLYDNTPPPISVGQWTHIAATYDSTEGVASIYFNGSLFLTATTDASGLPISELVRDSREDMILGAVLANAYHDSRFSSGLLDEVRIWETARTDAQISAFFNKKVNPVENGLIGYWNFDEEINSQLILDSSVYGHNGTLGLSDGVELGDPTRIISTAPIVVPEPASCFLVGLGILLLRKNHKKG